MDTFNNYYVGGSANPQGSEVFLRQLYETNRDRDHEDIVYNVFGIIVNSVANWAHGQIHLIIQRVPI